MTEAEMTRQKWSTCADCVNKGDCSKEPKQIGGVFGVADGTRRTNDNL